MTASEIAKTILGCFLAAEIILFILLYRFGKHKNLNAYLYLLSTLAILCALAFLCFDSKLFVAEHDAQFYYIELIVYALIDILAAAGFWIFRKLRSGRQ